MNMSLKKWLQKWEETEKQKGWFVDVTESDWGC